MTELSDCLATHQPTLLAFPEGVQLMPDPVSWALRIFEVNAQYSTLQIMKWDRDGISPEAYQSKKSSAGQGGAMASREDLYRLDQNDPQTFRTFLDGVQNGRAVHGRLELFKVFTDEIRSRQDVQWPFQIFRRFFYDALKRRHPLGFHATGSMWLSAGDSHYPPHMDIQDAVLMHLAGSKTIRLWPTPAEYLDQAVFSHEDLHGRMRSQPVEFTFQPGQIVFIPGGAVHEVIAHGNTPAVSVSLHMGSPYPLVILCQQLNKLSGREVAQLPDAMRTFDKDEAWYFEPSAFMDRGHAEAGEIPAALFEALLNVMQYEEHDQSELQGLLNRWWQSAVQASSYFCPYPREWRI